jgi:hypothetical protein
MSTVTVCHIADGINLHSEQSEKYLILEITNTFKVTNGCSVMLQEFPLFHNITQALDLLRILYIAVVICYDDIHFFFWELGLPAEVVLPRFGAKLQADRTAPIFSHTKPTQRLTAQSAGPN